MHTMKSNFVPCITYKGALFGKSLQGVAGDEPGGFDVVFVEELQHASSAMCTSPQAAGDVVG